MPTQPDPDDTAVVLDAATKPMCLVAVDQPLVDDLTRLVIHLGRAFSVTSDEVPAPLADLYTQAIGCQVWPADSAPSDAG